MATATVVAQLVFGIPMGRLADKIGRKRIIYSLTPLWYASNLFLAFSPSPVALVLSAVLLAFYSISSGATSAMTLELFRLSSKESGEDCSACLRGWPRFLPPSLEGLYGGSLALYTSLSFP